MGAKPAGLNNFSFFLEALNSVWIGGFYNRDIHFKIITFLSFMVDQDNVKSVHEVLTKIKEKSDDDYEKNITYISSGTLILSLTFIEKIVALDKSTALFSLIISWILLAITLLINLISHQISSFYHEKVIDEVKQYSNFDGEKSSDEKKQFGLSILEKITKNNNIIRFLNWLTTGTLITGIFFLILYCSLNAIKMTNEKVNNPNSSSNYTEKGRTIIVDLSSIITTDSVNTNSNSNSGKTSDANESSSNSKKK